MQSKKLDNKRRQILGTTLGLGVLGAALPSAWTKPLVNAVVLPAHAGTSICPMIVVDNIVIGPVSGAVLTCQITFDLLSSDSSIPLTITSVTANPTGAATFDGTNRVTLERASASCNPGAAVIIEDIAFMVEATCSVSPDPVTLDFNLSDLAGISVA